MCQLSTKKSDKKYNCRDIAKLRQGNDMTQADLATLMGVSMRTVSGWETGDRPPKDIGKLLSKIEEILSTESRNTSQAQEEREEQEMWKDKYIEQLELNLKQQIEISSLKEKLMGKPIPLAKKKKIL